MIYCRLDATVSNTTAIETLLPPLASGNDEHLTYYFTFTTTRLWQFLQLSFAFALTCATLSYITHAYGQPIPDLILTRALAWSQQRFTFETEPEKGGP